MATMRVQVLEVGARERAAAAFSNARTPLYQRFVAVVTWKRMRTPMLIVVRLLLLLLLLQFFCFINCNTGQLSQNAAARSGGHIKRHVIKRHVIKRHVIKRITWQVRHEARVRSRGNRGRL